MQRDQDRQGPPTPQSTFVGVRLGATEQTATGLCAIRDGVVVGSDLVRSNNDVIAWINSMAPARRLVAFDSPLIVPNQTGQRPCEQAIDRWLGSREASAPRSSQAVPRLSPEPRGAVLCRALGLNLDPRAARAETPSRAIEVYPHASIVTLFALPKTLKYRRRSGRTIEARSRELAVLLSLVESLQDADPSLEIQSSRWPALRASLTERTTNSVLARIETEVDAYICAYSAAFHETHGANRSAVVGDVRRGYIVVPFASAHGVIPAGELGALNAILRRLQLEPVAVANDRPR